MPSLFVVLVLFVVTSRSLVGGYRRFEGISYLHHDVVPETTDKLKSGHLRFQCFLSVSNVTGSACKCIFRGSKRRDGGCVTRDRMKRRKFDTAAGYMWSRNATWWLTSVRPIGSSLASLGEGGGFPTDRDVCLPELGSELNAFLICPTESIAKATLQPARLVHTTSLKGHSESASLPQNGDRCLLGCDIV
jgi:hypothetical protein